MKEESLARSHAVGPETRRIQTWSGGGGGVAATVTADHFRRQKWG